MASLGASLERTAALHGQRTAVIDADGRTWDWSSWRSLVARSASWLAAQGLQRAQRFAIVGLNSSRYAALLQAGFRAGCIPVPINHRLAPREVAAILQQAQCRRWLVEPEFAALADAPELAAWRGSCTLLPAEPWPATLASLPEAPLAAVSPTDEALLLFTGGTSGRAKGVPLSHAQILANALQTGSVLAPRVDDVVLHVAPMFHSAELVLAGYALHGAAHAYLPRFTPELFLAAVQRHRVTATLLVPTMLVLLLRSGLIAQHDVGSLRRVIYGASPMSPEAIEMVAGQLPAVALVQGYGLTETAPLLTMLDDDTHQRALGGEHRERMGSCGRALPAVELRILDAQGHVLPQGAVGEIAVRGPNVFAGYLDDPQATDEAWRDGAFATGDIGRLDDEGYLFLLDRRKDVIITGGENVYSVEVENVLLQHPAVAEAAVIGVSDPVYGQAVHAVVVLQPDADVDTAALQRFCRSHIGGFKIPRSIHYQRQLPRTAMGKVMKSALREQLQP
ncbi:AMP-binding protein [Comamonadaceae bacterium G21597-S1]|nr:AMP-binding protein [Comamonadaceae bacterium G21597-S1]